MNNLNRLTRTFHDATIINIIQKEQSLCIHMVVYEIGDHYGSNGYNENRELLSKQEIESLGEYKRQLKVIFYNAKNIHIEFDFVKMDTFTLGVVEFSIIDNIVNFGCDQEFNNGAKGWQSFSFEADGFDLRYLKDKEKKI